MSNIIVGSKTLAGWFDSDDPEYWEINGLLDALQRSILANVVKQTEGSIEQAEELQRLNEPVVWAFRELNNLKKEMLEMMQGDAK